MPAKHLPIFDLRLIVIQTYHLKAQTYSYDIFFTRTFSVNTQVIDFAQLIVNLTSVVRPRKGSRSFFINEWPNCLMCLPTSWFCRTPYHLSIFRFEEKIMELDFANKLKKLIQQHDFITVMSNTVALLRTVKSSWRIVRSVQTVSVANGPYSEHIRSVHLIMTSEHSVLRSVRSVRIVTVRMLRAVDGSYAPNKSSELLTVRILSTYGECIYGPYDPYES